MWEKCEYDKKIRENIHRCNFRGMSDALMATKTIHLQEHVRETPEYSLLSRGFVVCKKIFLFHSIDPGTDFNNAVQAVTMFYFETSR